MGGCVGSHHDSSGSLNENSDGTGGTERHSQIRNKAKEEVKNPVNRDDGDVCHTELSRNAARRYGSVLRLRSVRQYRRCSKHVDALHVLRFVANASEKHGGKQNGKTALDVVLGLNLDRFASGS
ncbi:ubiquitin domain-containing protein 2 [Tachysurus ichikawai]